MPIRKMTTYNNVINSISHQSDEKEINNKANNRSVGAYIVIIIIILATFIIVGFEAYQLLLINSSSMDNEGRKCLMNF